MLNNNNLTTAPDEILRQLQAKEGPFDLHTHTVVSDGHETLLGLTEMAAARGLSHLAISDHDIPLYHRKARILSLRCGIDVIPSVELNVVHRVGHKTVLLHAGIPWVPHDDEELNALIDHNRQIPQDLYPKAMLQKLYNLGIDPSGEGVDRSYEMIQKLYPSCEYIGKGVVADLLVDTGFVSSRAEASQLYLGEHGERRAHVDKTELYDYVTTEQLMNCIRRLNRERDTAALVIFNHPFHYGLELDELETLVAELTDMGIHGLEVYYPKHDRAREELLLGWCEKYGLLPTVGSDYHYDAHTLAKGDPALFRDLLRAHRKEYQPAGKNWW